MNGASIRGYDVADGSELWRLAPNSELVIATPVLGDDVVYVSAGYAPVKPIYAVRLDARGTIDAEPGEPHDGLAWSHGRGGAYMPTPLLYRGMLYVVHHNGRMVAYDAASGDAIYKTRFSAGGTFTASPVAADGKVYIGTEEGHVYVIAAGPEFVELAVNEGSAIVAAGTTIGALREQDISVLTLHRGTTVIPNPRSDREIEVDDRLLCFGRFEAMRALVPERRRRNRLQVQPLPDEPLPEDG